MNFYTTDTFESLPMLIAGDHEIIDSPLYVRDEKEHDKQNLLVFKLTLSGYGIFNRSGKEYKLQKGDCFLWEVGDDTVSYCYPEEGSEPWEFIWFNFRFSDLKPLVEEINNKMGDLLHIPENSEKIINILDFLNVSIKTGKTQIETITGANIIHTLFELIIENHTGKTDNKVYKSLSNKAKDYIESSVQKDITVQDIAQYLGITREYLTRLFSKQFGVTPSYYIKQEKLQKARILLLTTDQPVKEVCYNIGISSPERFRKLFKQEFGFTPGNYRKIKLQ